jgi:hypothetical protein
MTRLQRIKKARNHKLNTYLGAIVLAFLAICILIATLKGWNTQKLISPPEIKPVPPVEIKVQEIQAVEEDYFIQVDRWVSKYVDEFFSTKSQRSEMRMIMHCLLNRESKHNGDTGRGDGGLAIGILQFHQETWNGYRKLMIKEGLTETIGSPLNNDQAIRTTVWAIKNKRATAWGPIARWNQGRYTEATCPMPSFYK